MNLLNHIARISIGTIFILSGLAKLYPIEPFEIVFVDLGISNFLFAPFIARFIIAFEIFIGCCIVFNSWFKGFVYKLAVASLFFFYGVFNFFITNEGK